MTDLVLTNATIRTGDPAAPFAEAIALRGDTIVAVGDLASVRASVPNAAEVDLGGGAVIPGLIDPHNHLLATGQLLGELALYDVRAIADLQAALREHLVDIPANTWVSGRGWDETLMADGRMPTRHDLDAVAPDHPVVLQRVWNTLVCNTRALEMLGLDATTPDPPADTPYAGSFDREPDGHPTGIFRDRAKGLVLEAMPQTDTDTLAAAIRRACDTYAALGITAVVDPGLRPHQIDAYHAAVARGDVTIRVDMLVAAWGFVPADEEVDLHERIGAMRDLQRHDTDLLRLTGVKLLPDGGVGDRTARLLEPYLGGDGDEYGVWAVPEADLPRHIRWVHDQGWPMDIHTCGDAAQEVTVRAFADAQNANPRPTLRHRVHHAYLPTPESLERMARHRIPAVISTPFIRSLGESFVRSLGPERAERIMPFRTYLDAGVPLAGSSDSTVADFDPWVGMATALTRATITGRVLGADQTLTPEEALALYTTGAAFAMGREDELGMIAPGYKADLAVLAQDPFAGDVDPDELMATRPQRVMVNGAWVVDV